MAGRLIAGRGFTKKLEAVNPTSGADTGYPNLGIVGSYVYRTSVSPDGTRLAAVANITSVSGRGQTASLPGGPRGDQRNALGLVLPAVAQAVLPGELQLLPARHRLQPGRHVLRRCRYRLHAQVRGPERHHLRRSRPVRNSQPAPGPPHLDQLHGGDTLHSVAVTTNAVYVGGHQRWLDNPWGKDTCGAGCAPRPAIAVIGPVTGKALSWNPNRTRGVGAKELLLTPAGLWVGSDTGYGGKLGCSATRGINHDDCNGLPLENHAGIGFLPLE